MRTLPPSTRGSRLRPAEPTPGGGPSHPAPCPGPGADRPAAAVRTEVIRTEVDR